MIFKHSGGRGDLIYSLPVVRDMGGGSICVPTGVSLSGPPMSCQDVSLLNDLLLSQSYIDSVEVLNLQSIDADLDRFRLFLSPSRHLAISHLMAFDIHADLSLPWLETDMFSPLPIARIVINRTGRFHGFLDWGELKGRCDCVFVGLPGEHSGFIRSVGFDVPYYRTETYVDLFRVILGSSLFIGNQSFSFALAEAIKHKRVLEVFPNAPNCLPIGDGSYSSIRHAISELL